eukprot:TRINITY_DN10963_c0_g1_i1.p1 TRINITY_DN10963_c0_g1~~TRINITY_DN10963_c0_g1_i1.p1  ORF type:complete len:327 (-),score=43.69 TRINITY_DN10963_c0_g1_i1:98-1078(-)
MVTAFFLGFSYMIPLIIGWNIYPQRKGFVSGVILTGYGLSPVMFNLLTYYLINPNDEKPTDVRKDIDGIVRHYFTESVYKNVPKTLHILSGIYLVVLCISLVFYSYSRYFHQEDKSKQTLIQQSSSDNDDAEFKAGIKSKMFFILLLTLVSSLSPYFFFNANYKTLGLEIGYEDQVLTGLGITASLINGLFRTMWSVLLDCLSFRYVFIPIVLIQTVLLVTFLAISRNFVTYFIWVVGFGFIGGGYFSVFPTITSKIFGNQTGAKLYGCFFGAAISNFVQYAATVILINKLKVDYIYLFGSFGVTSILAALISLKVKEPPKPAISQ